MSTQVNPAATAMAALAAMASATTPNQQLTPADLTRLLTANPNLASLLFSQAGNGQSGSLTSTLVDQQRDSLRDNSRSRRSPSPPFRRRQRRDRSRSHGRSGSSNSSRDSYDPHRRGGRYDDRYRDSRDSNRSRLGAADAGGDESLIVMTFFALFYAFADNIVINMLLLLFLLPLLPIVALLSLLPICHIWGLLPLPKRTLMIIMTMMMNVEFDAHTLGSAAGRDYHPVAAAAEPVLYSCPVVSHPLVTMILLKIAKFLTIHIAIPLCIMQILTMNISCALPFL